MNLLFVNGALALIWTALTGAFNPGNLLLGFLIGYLMLFLTRRVYGPTLYFSKVIQIVRFILYFLWELLVANLRVAVDILRPGPPRIQPRVIAVPLDVCSDLEITLLANTIALTPGSLSLDVSDVTKRPCYLYVHHMYAPDRELTRQQIKQGFERLVLDLMGKNGGRS